MATEYGRDGSSGSVRECNNKTNVNTVTNPYIINGFAMFNIIAFLVCV